MLAGTLQNISEVFVELRGDLEIKSNEVTTTATRYLGRTLVKTEEEYNFGVVASYVENMPEEFNKTALKSSQTPRWERREIGEQELPASEQRVYRHLVGKWLWSDRVDLHCAIGKVSSSLGRASDTYMRNVKSVLRYLRGNPGIMAVRPTTLNLEAVKRAPVDSVLTYRDSDCAGDADRFSVSGTASWLRRKQSTVALSSGEAELVAALSGACEGMQTDASQRSSAVIPLQRWE